MDKTKTNPHLGLEVHKHLLSKGVETPGVGKFQVPSKSEVMDIVRGSTFDSMTAMGLDMEDDSLCETPNRVAKMYCNEILYGLNTDNFPKCTVIENKMGYNEMLMERNVKVMSFCEHHLLPILGQAHVAYIPGKNVIGLSKIQRVVDFFSRRPQVQERLTEQVFHALQYVLGTEDVAVVIAAEHLCVKMRGVEDVCSDTVSAKLGGSFLKPEVRAEFYAMIKI